MRLSLLAAALLASSVAASATTIDFSTLPQGNPVITTYTENGFTVQVIAGSFNGTSGNGAPPPSIYTPTNSGTIDVTDGGLFDFSSVALGNGAFSGTANFTITGLLNGVSLFQAMQSVGATQFNTYNYAADSAFSIDTLRIAVTGDGNIDNINVNTVTPAAAVTPEPSSIALLSTGLLGIVGVMKRRFA